MKKFLSILFVLLLLVTVAIAEDGTGNEDPCQNHVYEFSYDSPSDEGYEMVDAYSHAYFEYYLGYCEHCLETATLKTRVGALEDHEFGEHRDGGHVGTKHLFTRTCRICGYMTTESVFCPGPNGGGCIQYPYRVLPELIVE